MLATIVVANVVTRKRSRRSGLKVSANESRHDSMTMMMGRFLLLGSVASNVPAARDRMVGAVAG